MRNEKLKIDVERGVAHVYGEELKLAGGYARGDGMRWSVYARTLKPNERYDVVLKNDRGEVIGVFAAYYVPHMFALDVYPVWAPDGVRYRRCKINERSFEIIKL